jgi:hypothetical protein
MRPRAREMYNEVTSLPCLTMRVIACNFPREGIELLLLHDDRTRANRFILLHEAHHSVLFTHALLGLHLQRLRLAAKLQTSLMPAEYITPRVQAVAVVRKQEVDFLGRCGVGESFVDDIDDFDVRVCYQAVEVHPPYPVVFAGLDEALGHVEFVEADGEVGVGFEVDNEVVAVATGVVCANLLAAVTAGIYLVI